MIAGAAVHILDYETNSELGTISCRGKDGRSFEVSLQANLELLPNAQLLSLSYCRMKSLCCGLSVRLSQGSSVLRAGVLGAGVYGESGSHGTPQEWI